RGGRHAPRRAGIFTMILCRSGADERAPRPGDVVPELIAAWAAPTWREATLQYHKARDGRVSIVPYAPEEIARLRRLMDDDISLDRAWHELHGRQSAAAASTVEALVFGLRDGLVALSKN